MDLNYQPPASLDVSKLTIRKPSPRLNPNNNDTDSDPDGHPPKLQLQISTSEAIKFISIINKSGPITLI